jgi:hypothetical protein
MRYQENHHQFSILNWSKITVYGWAIGIVLIIVVSSFLDALRIEGLQFYIGLCMGGAVGLAQWMMLKKYVRISVNWIWCSMFGMAVPFAFVDIILTELVNYKLLIGIGLGGLSTGFLQSYLLRNHVKYHGQWVIGCFMGWMLAGTTVLLVNVTMKFRPEGYLNLVLALLNLILLLAGGIVLGLITGHTLNSKWTK